MQSDFQRTFIILRPLDGEEAGSSGFCRMERSQNRGKLVFNLQGLDSGSEAHAVLVKKETGEYKVMDCGLLRVDQRGNGTVTREIEGLTTQASAAHHSFGVVRVTPDGVSLRLLGFIGKGKPVERELIESAAARTFGLAQAPQNPPEQTPEPLRGTKEPSLASLVKEESGIVHGQIEAPAAQPDLPVSDNRGDAGIPNNIWAAPPQDAGEFPAAGLPQELEGIVWPESILSLRELFERFDVVSPVTGSEAEVFIRVPLKNGVAGVDHYLLGVRLYEGTISDIGYAVPGTESMPPVGLDGYQFFETPIGGYWIRWEAVEAQKV